MHPSQKLELEAQAKKIIKACDDQLVAAQERANQAGLNVMQMFTSDGHLLAAPIILAKSNALLTIATINQPKEK